MANKCILRELVNGDSFFGAGAAAAELRGSVGHRIDAICSQLITSRQHTSVPPAAFSLYDNVVVKKEVDDSDPNVALENSRDSESYVSHHHHQYHARTQRHHSPRNDADAAAAAATADKDNMFSTHHSPTHSALAALTDW